MLERRGKRQRPQLIFTSDFHELVRGDLIPGCVVLRYDPLRIVPAEEVTGLPATQHAVTVYCRYHPDGSTWQNDMRFAPAHRLVVDYDITGQGTMLGTEFSLPQGCNEIECWFSYVDNHGRTRWDSDLGKNFWMRFPTYDLEMLTAELVDVPEKPLNLFNVEVESVPDVDGVLLRWRYTALPTEPRRQQVLELSKARGRRKTWAPVGDGLSVASETPIAFDLVYTVGGHQFTDDNDGTWYVVSK